MTYDTGVIKEFRGEYYFLSNYCITPFTWRRTPFQSGEHAFAYAKTFFANKDKEQYVGALEERIRTAPTPGEAKKLGRALTIDVDEWDKHRVQYMREIVHAKFMTGKDSNGMGIVGPLCNTGAKMLIEGNDWNDLFWGRCKGEDGVWRGLNTLGVILMETRGFWNQQKVCCTEHKISV
jgi:ribA/ribD-fused uncharacterized protein